MTAFKPTLTVRRMLVLRGASAAYDERFHPGVNVIRGDNSSGKSTILNLLYFGLGGDVSDWSDAALKCDTVIVEVEFNNSTATLKRNISTTSAQPMYIFGGAYEEAGRAEDGRWLKYPYKRSKNLESFSQAIFRLMGLGDVASEATGNITVHQFLRLMYADQLSPVEHIFKFERFDSPVLRDILGRLHLGAYNPKLYENEIVIRTKQKQIDVLDGELKALVSVLTARGKKSQALTVEWAREEAVQLAARQKQLGEAIAKAHEHYYASRQDEAFSLSAQREAYSAMSQAQSEFGATTKEVDRIQLDIADSSTFIASLEKKLADLQDAAAVEQHLGLVSFGACPACYAPVEQSLDGACALCKTPYEEGDIGDRLAAMVNETALQLRQSRQLQEGREKRLIDAVARRQAAESEWQRAASEYEAVKSAPTSEARANLDKLQRESGYITKELEGATERLAMAEAYAEKVSERKTLEAQVALLQEENADFKRSSRARISVAFESIESEIRSLLKSDLRRQDSFETADRIMVDFGANSISVDDVSYFSASSRVILKSSFYIGMLAAAAMDKGFNHPRFVLLDTTEDKGMEPVRSQNFQEKVLEVSERLTADHQIIFSTSMVSNKLDQDSYTVGRFSTRDNPTLSLAP